MSHTSGPWRVFNFEGDSGYAIVHPMGRIAAVENEGPLEEQLANARLISAAPELLASAKEMLRVLESEHYVAGQMASLRIVIAKAEGEGG